MSHKLPKVKGFKRFLHLSSCLGASVVILGALFKIMHWPGSGPMLILGLGTEAFLFALFASDIPHEEYDWSLAYPELGGMGAHEGEEAGSDLPLTNQLDNLLEEAKIGPELIESLGNGMRSLSDTAGKIADISNATAATNEYVDSVKSASRNVSTLADTYSKAASAISDLASSNDAGQSIGESLNKVSKNLSALNATYELQLQGSKEHLDATNKFYDGLQDLMKNLHDSVDDTKTYRQEMSKLSSNLTSLNQIYGNMLSAMKA
jgi:gliding motility-associated protein GldL